jgi:glutamine synthetase
VEASPRVALKRQVKAAMKKGYRVKTGVECEFFLIDPSGERISDEMDKEEKPCYDQSALMRRYDVISEICDAMLSLGWNPYQNDHEDANGQFEMNWDYDDCLKTADRHTFFKFMAKSIAEKHGYRATFMPKPFANLSGNGCHAHVSVWDKEGKKNLFLNKSDEMGLSKLAYQFLGGVMHNAISMAAIFIPSINSYKRIDAAVTSSGATWSPNAVTYSGNNRTHMVRIPDPGRFEIRLMDGATNPYLLQAAVVAAGLDGVNNKRDPGKRVDLNMYTEQHKLKNLRKLPANLLDAIRLLDNSKVARSAFGDEFVDSYVKLKREEWQRFMREISPWERDHTLDC